MKKNIIILANCQGSPLLNMLNKYYSELYFVKHYTNYQYIRNNIDLPQDLKEADIFLYQNYSNEDEKYNLLNIIENVLKKECLKISFPTLHSCNLLFCYNCDEPNNFKTITTDKPFGEYYFGISCIVDEVKKYNKDICDKNIIIKSILDTSKNYNFISEETMLFHKNRSFEFLEKKCLTSDIPDLYYFIKNNFTKKRLWHNPNHPTGILLNELIKMIFMRLNLNYIENGENINMLDKSLSDWVMPIFPCVKKYLNLDFEINSCSSWYNNQIIDSDSYITEYLSSLYLDA
jgi:hypothetical protein